jgi:hypothetical protein
VSWSPCDCAPVRAAKPRGPGHLTVTCRADRVFELDNAGESVIELRFSEADLPDAVYSEQLTSTLYLDKRDDVNHYTEIMNHLSTEALTPPAPRASSRRSPRET